ncbi:hypothetical protein ACJX0J_017501, partial [Zea mays]
QTLHIASEKKENNLGSEWLGVVLEKEEEDTFRTYLDLSQDIIGDSTQYAQQHHLGYSIKF